MKLLPLLISLFLFAEFSHAEVYKWIDQNGKIQFSDKKPELIKAEELKLKVNTYTNVTFDNSVFDVGPKVVMYSTDWCHYCKKARQYFKKNNIAYTEYDIDKNKKAKRRYKKMGATGVPVILVGKKRMNGFNKKGFERIYN